MAAQSLVRLGGVIWLIRWFLFVVMLYFRNWQECVQSSRCLGSFRVLMYPLMFFQHIGVLLFHRNDVLFGSIFWAACIICFFFLLRLVLAGALLL